MHLVNLTDDVRQLMVEEINLDIAANTLYYSERFNGHRDHKYPELLKEAAASYDSAWLQTQLEVNDMIKSQEQRRTKSGFIMVKVPYTAAQTLAEGEFNRFYLRALCRKTISLGQPELEIYRSKAVLQPRSESQRKIGTKIDATALLADLRCNTSVDASMKLPAGPNSGLSAMLIGIQ